MAEYLSPSIGMVIPQLDKTCEDITRHALVRGVTDYTKGLCEYDPELADILLEGTKSLPRCIRYILEQAQQVVAKNVEAMPEKEFTALDNVTVHGKAAAMVGAAISDEEVFQWAKDYYYGGSSVEPAGKKKPTEKEDKKPATKKSVVKGLEKTGTGTDGSASDKSESEGMQMTLGGFNAA